MSYIIKNFIFSLLFNSSLLVILIIGIQNSSNKSKVNFIINESVELPISFIIGISFIGGSLFGNFINITEGSKENKH
tara:strand:+ start:500 stop:730 length:231 start_codon:yes stop_codon:yes gene_type:complete